jgi:hypothetical protein
MDIIPLLEREREKLSKERDLIIRFMKSPDFGKRTPENYGLELARISGLIKQYDRAIESLRQPSEIELDPGNIITECLDLAYSNCRYWEGIEAYITREKGKEDESGLYVAIPINHPWYKESEFDEKPLSVIRIGKWALCQFKVRKYQGRLIQYRYLSNKLNKLTKQAVKVEGWRT